MGGSIRIPGTLCAARVPGQSHVALSQVSGCTPPSPHALPAAGQAQTRLLGGPRLLFFCLPTSLLQEDG